MNLFLALIARTAVLSLRAGGGAYSGLVFFLSVVAVVPFGVGPDLPLLARSERTWPTRCLARLQPAQAGPLAIGLREPFVDRGAIHAVAGDHRARAFAFTHPLYRHQSDRFLRLSIQFASVFLHAHSDNTRNLKFPSLSTYLLINE